MLIERLSRIKSYDFRKLGKTTYDALDYLSKAALVCGIIFSIYQFNAYKQDERIRYTFQFLERFDSDRLLNARLTIEAAIRSHEQTIIELNTTRMRKQDAEALRKRIATFLVVDSNGGKGIRRELELTVDFFDALSVCLRQRLCDQDVAQAFLAGQAKMLWTNFAPYVKERRGVIPGYGGGLEAFAA